MTHVRMSPAGSRRIASACLTIMLAALLASCGRNTPYDTASDLIRDKKYEEAMTVLSTIPRGDSLRARADMALVLCRIGKHYGEGNIERAAQLVDSAVVENDVRRYVLNIPPSDSLYPHAAALAMLVYSKAVGRMIEEYLKAQVNEANRDFYRGTNQDPQLLWSEVMVTLEGEAYQPVDQDAYFGGSLVDPPWIRSVRFDTLCPADEYRDDVERAIEKFREYKKAIDAKAGEYRARFGGFGR